MSDRIKFRIAFLLFMTLIVLMSLVAGEVCKNCGDITGYKWSRLSAGGGGAMFSPQINPNDENMLMFNCDMNGNYISYDSGKTFDFNSFGYRVFVSYIPSENVVYMGGNALLKSIDKGKTFKQIFPNPNKVKGISYRGVGSNKYFENNDTYNTYHNILAITTNKNNEDILYVVSKSNYSSDSTLYFSKDGGKNFEVILNYRSNAVHNVYADEINANIVYLFHDNGIMKIDVTTKKVEKVYNENIENGIAYSQKFYVIKKVNDIKFNNSIFLLNDNFNGDNNITKNFEVLSKSNKVNFSSLDVSNDGTLVAGFGSNYESFGIGKTKDEGKNWSVYNECSWCENKFKLTNNGYLQDGDYAGDAPLGITVSKTNSNFIMYTTYYSAYLTKNGGTTWQQLESNYAPDGTYSSTGVDVTNVHRLSIDPNDSNHFLMGNSDVGLFESTNAGATWLKNVNGVPRNWYENNYGNIFIPEKKDLVFSIWSRQNNIPLVELTLEKINTLPGGVTISRDGGKTHTPIVNVFPENTIPASIKYLYDKSTRKYSIYICFLGHGIYKSMDLGNKWIKINNGIDENNLYAYDIVTDNNNTLYTIFTNSKEKKGNVYYSNNGGVNWIPVNLPNEKTKLPTSIAFDKNNKMYLSFLSTLPNNSEFPYSWIGGGVYTSTNQGKNWTTILEEDNSIMGLYYDGERMFISGFSQELKYFENNVIKTIEGFEFKNSSNVLVQNDIIYVLTYGAGIWKATPIRK